jgi:uncharacterized protein YbjT (DUF2867 family)
MSSTAQARATFAVVGATGNTGKVVAEALLAAGQTVRVLGRDAAKLAPLVAKGAVAVVGDATDAAFLAAAFTGVDAVYAMIPPNYAAPDMGKDQDDLGQAIAGALAAAKVPHVVSLSSIGAQLASGTGPIRGLHRQEQRLDRLAGSSVLHLRAGYFLENLLHQAPLVKTAGITGSPLRADARLAMIATKDIGAYAAKRLLARDFAGKSSVELQGAADASMADVTAALAKALDRQLAYVQFPYDAAAKAMVDAGMSPDAARLMNEMNDGFNAGTIRALEPRSAATTTPTTLERFVRDVLAPAVRG